jgi:hypothetical protein
MFLTVWSFYTLIVGAVNHYTARLQTVIIAAFLSSDVVVIMIQNNLLIINSTVCACGAENVIS